MPYSVEQRRREIGIRLALGASPNGVRKMVAFESARLASAGVAIGTISAAGLARFLASLLYGVKPDDPVSFLVVPLVLGSVAFVAAWIPAVRASRVDPSVALRAE
jgi:putative ABC transport system permease protein